MRISSLLLGLAALTLAAAGALLVTSGDPAPPRDVAPAADDDPPAPEAGTNLQFAGEDEAARLAPGEPDPGGVAQDGEREGEDREAVDEDAAPGVGAEVLVVAGEPPVPVAGAEVFFVLEADGRAAAEARPAERRPATFWDYPAQLGQRARSDREGRLHLPPDPRNWLVSAQQEGLFGFGSTRRNRRLTVRLEPDETVNLVGRRSDGSPAAGQPLAIVQSPRRGRAATVWQGEFDAAGRRQLPHFQRLREAEHVPDEERFAAMLTAPTATPVLAEFVGRPATTEPIVLQLPPLASLAVRLVDHRGTPLLTPARILVRSTPREGADREFPYDAAAQLVARLAKPIGPDPVAVGTVAAGTELQIAPRFAQAPRVPPTTVFSPPEDGGHLAVDVPLAGRQLVLAGRLVGADGQPLAGAQPAANLWNAERDASGLDVATTGDGAFDVVLDQPAAPGPFWFVVRTTTDAGKVFGARIALPPLVGGQRCELGSVQLEELPPLAQGRVVDDRGEPIANANVQVQQQQPPDPRRPDQPRWRNLAQLAAETAADGTFALFGDRPPGLLQLHAECGGHFDSSVTLQVIGQTCELRLDRHGVLRGSAQLPPWVADGSAQVQLRDAGGSTANTTGLRRRRGGRFVIGELRQGRYDVLFTVRNLAEPVLVVPDVFVRPGDNDDPRLQVDLNQLLFRHSLRAVDMAGQPFAIDSPLLVKLAKSDGTVADAGFRWQKGRADIVSGTALLDVTAFAPGCPPQHLQLPPGEHDICLPRQAPALLELPGVRALCGPTRRVRVSVILDGDTGMPQNLSGFDQRNGQRFSFARWDLGKSGGAWLGDSDTVAVPLMLSGKYEVVLRMHATDTERSPQASVSLGTYELRTDGSAFTPVRVPLPAAQIAQAIAGVEAQLAQQQRAAAERAAQKQR